MIHLLLVALLADPDPPLPPPPLQPEPQPVIREYSNWGGPIIAVTTVDTVCDHGNRVYRYLNSGPVGSSNQVGSIAVVPQDPTCPKGTP